MNNPNNQNKQQKQNASTTDPQSSEDTKTKEVSTVATGRQSMTLNEILSKGLDPDCYGLKSK